VWNTNIFNLVSRLLNLTLDIKVFELLRSKNLLLLIGGGCGDPKAKMRCEICCVYYIFTLHCSCLGEN